MKEQAEWKIPPSISNWKNAKGYTIPLDKRLAADGRGLQGVHINENFAKLASALYIADRKVSISLCNDSYLGCCLSSAVMMLILQP